MWAFECIGPSQLQPVDAPTPEPLALNDNEVLVRFEAAGICGSDLAHFSKGGPPEGFSEPQPGWPCHEIVGTVVATRGDLEIGCRVVGWAKGMAGLSQFVVANATELAVVSLNWADALVVPAQLTACVLHAVDCIGDVRGSRVAILGLGAAGTIFGHALSRRGAYELTGVDHVDRTTVAAHVGFDAIHHSPVAEWASLRTDARPDLIVEAIGHNPEILNDAICAAASQGRIYQFGIPAQGRHSVDLGAFLRKNLTLMAGTATARRTYLERAQQYLKEHPDLARSLVTLVTSVTNAQAAYLGACLRNRRLSLR